MDAQHAIERFLSHGQAERNLSDRTLRAYESDLQQFRGHLEGTEVSRVTPDDLENYVTTLGERTYRDTSIRRKVAALKVFFRYLEEAGVVDESPARRLRTRQPTEARVPNVLSHKEIKALLSAPKRHIAELAEQKDGGVGAKNRYFCAIRDNVIIELLFSTGIRIGELVALDVADVDAAARTIEVTGRGTRPRQIEITSDDVVEALRDYLLLRADRGVPTQALFVGRSGTRLTIYSIENIFKKYVRNAEIKRHVTPHALRHTMASMMISGGADIRAVQEMLGHASILSTQVYTRLSIPRAKRSSIPEHGVTVDPSTRLSIRRK
ncbi:MAG TPA: tyrosine-type recombinase/integrase [Thermoanaerobaculia bacterium]|nr:tyrosine-type recombinase/integrase [Thermoanaerobaculia bacterium]